jgi:hypothetical protein
MRSVRWLVLTGLFVSTPAFAWTWFDNLPVVSVRINRSTNDVTSAVGYVEDIRMHKCGGGFTDYAVDQTIDLKNAFTKTVGTGDWCGVSVRWGSNVAITNGAWTVQYSELFTALPIDSKPATMNTALTPYDVSTPTFSGTAPRLYVTVN